MTYRPTMLCEDCRSALAYRETTRGDDGLPDGLILCGRCRAERKMHTPKEQRTYRKRRMADNPV